MVQKRKVKNVVLYLRVSTQEQTKNYSIKAQETELTQYCKAYNYNIVNIYKDEGISGKNFEDRIDFKKMIRKIDNNPNDYDAILIYKLSRISRDSADLNQLIKYLHERDIYLISKEDGIDTSTPMGKAMAQILGAIVEMERETILTQAKSGMKQRAREGKWNGGSVMGYTSKNKELIINEKEANTVKKIFDLYTNKNWGYSKICRYLNNRLEEYPTKKNSSWSYQTVKGILDNPIYIGKIRWDVRKDWNTKRENNRKNNKEKDYILVDGQHEPIISIDLWKRTRQKRELVGKKPEKKVHITYLLSGLPKCPQCGASMVSHRIKKQNKKNEYYRYYCCSQWANKKAVCKPNLINAKNTEKIVLEEIKEFVNQPDVIDVISKNVGGDIDTKELKNEIKIIEKTITNSKKNKEKYVDYLVDDDKVEKIGEKTLLEKIESLNSKIDKQEKELKKLRLKLNSINSNKLDYEKISILLKSFEKTFERADDNQKIKLLHNIIKEIKINPAEKLKDRTVKEIILHFNNVDLTKYNKDNTKKKNYEVICGTALRNTLYYKILFIA
ncbi:recombinase family protein [Dethiothermospora halolimnae]|uniref:recombinase family protein n=1 Tax=Dethiothermospora halolimnae TaxID=3114390 RepID=UPI003CCBD6DB